MWTLKTKWGEIIFDSPETIVEKVSKFSKITWWILIILWLVWIFLPSFMTIATLGFVAYLMIFAWISIFSFTYLSNKKDWLGYLKWFVLLFSWIFIVIKPELWIQVLWIIFIFYFFIDWFINLLLASAAWFKNWAWIWFINAILLFWLGVIFIYSWGGDLELLIWIFVWISLFFDWISLLMTWKFFNKFLKN